MERPGEKKFPHLFQSGRVGKFELAGEVAVGRRVSI
jgi:hypothetical protein